jgi:hypothetical protein
MREAIIHKEVWVPSEKSFQFKESVNPNTGERKYILSGMMLPFETVSRNNVMYNKPSIISKHKLLIGRPLMYNHKVDSDMLPKGHFIDSWVDAEGWKYKADVDPAETDLIRKLDRGDLRHVSIQLIGGRIVERLSGEGKPFTEAWVEDIIEGSIVPAPGFLDTTAEFAEAFRTKKETFKEDMTTTTADGAVATKILDKKEIEKRAKELVNSIGERDTEKLLEQFYYPEGRVMKSLNTPAGKLELRAYSEGNYSVLLNQKEWCHRKQNYVEILMIFNKLKGEAIKGSVSSPFSLS